MRWDIPPGVVPRPHPQMPKATARRGTERIPKTLRARMAPPLEKASLEDVLDDGILDASAARVIWNVNGRAVVQPVARFEVPDGLLLRPARRIGTYPEAPNRIGHYPVYRDGCALLLAMDSRLEMGWSRRFDICRSVDWMQTQPFVLTWDVGDRGLHMFPDILLRRDGGWLTVEVKPDEHADDPHVRLKWDLARKALAAGGVGHQHVGDLSQQAQTHLRQITRYRRVNPFFVELAEFVAEQRPAQVGNLIELCNTPRVGREVLFTLAANGICEVDLDAPITRATSIQWDDLGRWDHR